MDTVSEERTNRRRPLSAILKELSEEADDATTTVGDLVDGFGRRAFGALIFIFSIPNVLPLPPGSTTILGAPLLLLSPQVAIGARTPWLPRKVREHHVKASDVHRLFGKIIPKLEQVEKLSRPRLTFLFGPVGDRLIGVICTLLSFILILPIPLGNLAPAACIGVLAFALFQRDGVIALIGYALAALSAGLLVASASAVVLGVSKLIEMLGG